MSRILPFDSNTIYDLIKNYNTPLQLYDGNAIKENALEFINTFSKNISSFKRQFFAVKALPNPNILKLLTDIGMGLDCSSLSELKLAEILSIPGNKIMFTSNYTSKEDLEYALKMNVIINLDDFSLIETLYNINNKLPKKIFFRYNPGIGKTDSETKSNVLGGPDAKFGIEDYKIYKACKKVLKLGVNKIGIHVMTGSNVLNINYWEELIDKIFILINHLITTGITINYINLGGGIGINYLTGEKVDINALSLIINNQINKNIRKYQVMIPKIYMENGRYITGPYGYLITKCNVVKQMYNKTFYGLDACMSNLMRPGMYNSYHYISILDKNNSEDDINANVVGTLCENNDWFAKDRKLPIAKPDDIFIIWDTGAHSHSMGFQYNGKLRAPEILFIDNNFKLIRRREIFDDYISTVII